VFEDGFSLWAFNLNTPYKATNDPASSRQLYAEHLFSGLLVSTLLFLDSGFIYPSTSLVDKSIKVKVAPLSSANSASVGLVLLFFCSIHYGDRDRDTRNAQIGSSPRSRLLVPDATVRITTAKESDPSKGWALRLRGFHRISNSESKRLSLRP